MKYNMLLFLINSKTRSKFLKSFKPGTAFTISIFLSEKFISPKKIWTFEQYFIFWISKMSQISGSNTVNSKAVDLFEKIIIV